MLEAGGAVLLSLRGRPGGFLGLAALSVGGVMLEVGGVVVLSLRGRPGDFLALAALWSGGGMLEVRGMVVSLLLVAALSIAGDVSEGGGVVVVLVVVETFLYSEGILGGVGNGDAACCCGSVK